MDEKPGDLLLIPFLFLITCLIVSKIWFLHFRVSLCDILSSSCPKKIRVQYNASGGNKTNEMT